MADEGEVFNKLSNEPTFFVLSYNVDYYGY
jgi:hypothetical protein